VGKTPQQHTKLTPKPRSMYALLKPLLFRLSPETAHRATMWLLDAAAAFAPSRWLLRHWYTLPAPQLQTRVMGLEFPNPVGLAAGFDKDGKHIRGLACLGFGFIEVGTVTPLPQAGNPQPRLFRLPADAALINRMGFNNDGLDALVARLQRLRQQGLPKGLLLGGNIGKNKDTPNEQAASDYLRCFQRLFPLVDYFVVNVSSPNTPNLRALQEKEPLTRLLDLLQAENKAQASPKPILLKIAPDLTPGQVADIADIVRGTGLAGIIATNTTIERAGLHSAPTSLEAIGAGGLSGQPLAGRSTELIRQLRGLLGPEAVIIGVGGVDSPEAAQAKLAAGANLVQLYTGLVYEGPGLVRRILERC
jgi:dihydroorotate dehydrogenase